MILPPGGMPEFVPTFPWPVSFLLGGQAVERVRTPGEVRDAVRRMVDKGADWIKTTHTDKSTWLNKPDPPVFDDACFRALVDEARKQNRPVVMHQLWASGFRKAIELAVDSMEHTPLDALADDDINRMVKSGIPIIPTLDVFAPMINLPEWINTEKGKAHLCPISLKQTREVLSLYKKGITSEMARKEYYGDVEEVTRQFPLMIKNIHKLHKAGAIVGCGTDSGGDSFAVFGRIYAEINHLIKAGMTSFEALKSATSVNARILRLDDKIGTIEQGKQADFAVLDGNPLIDTTALLTLEI